MQLMLFLICLPGWYVCNSSSISSGGIMLLLLFFCHILGFGIVSATDRPIIGSLRDSSQIHLNCIACCGLGVVSQWYRPDYFPGILEADNHTSYIAARYPCELFTCSENFYPTCSYVKWLEAAGAQVVPVIISIDDNEDLTEYFQEVILILNNLPSNMFLNLNIFAAQCLFFGNLLGVCRGEWVADTRGCNFHLPFWIRWCKQCFLPDGKRGASMHVVYEHLSILIQ